MLLLNQLHFHLIRLFKQHFFTYDYIKPKSRLVKKNQRVVVKNVIRFMDSVNCRRLQIMGEFASLCRFNIIVIFLKNLQLFKLHLYFE